MRIGRKRPDDDANAAQGQDPSPELAQTSIQAFFPPDHPQNPQNKLSQTDPDLLKVPPTADPTSPTEFIPPITRPTMPTNTRPTTPSETHLTSPTEILPAVPYLTNSSEPGPTTLPNPSPTSHNGTPPEPTTHPESSQTIRNTAAPTTRPSSRPIPTGHDGTMPSLKTSQPQVSPSPTDQSATEPFVTSQPTNQAKTVPTEQSITQPTVQGDTIPTVQDDTIPTTQPEFHPHLTNPAKPTTFPTDHNKSNPSSTDTPQQTATDTSKQTETDIPRQITTDTPNPHYIAKPSPHLSDSSNRINTDGPHQPFTMPVQVFPAMEPDPSVTAMIPVMNAATQLNPKVKPRAKHAKLEVSPDQEPRYAVRRTQPIDAYRSVAFRDVHNRGHILSGSEVLLADHTGVTIMAKDEQRLYRVIPWHKVDEVTYHPEDRDFYRV